MVERVKYHHELARQFVINLENNMVHLAGVNFTLSPTIIVEAKIILDVGEKWNKRQNISKQHFEPYIKAKYHDKLSRVFPFKFLEDQFIPVMKLIIKYFTCEGRFSRLYAYHIRLLMHFTRFRMMSISYFICKNIERMTIITKRKPYPQQLNSIYHFSVIKIVVLHQLTQLEVSWETFIALECFKGSQIFSDPQEGGEPSRKQKELENKTEEVHVPVFVTDEIGTRMLFAATKRLLSPPGVEGVSFSSSNHRKMLPSLGVKRAFPSSLAKQLQGGDKGKQKMHEEGPTEGQDRDFILIKEDVTDLGFQNSRLKDVIIKEKEAEIQALSLNLEGPNGSSTILRRKTSNWKISKLLWSCK